MAKSDADLNVWMSSLTSAAMPTTPDRRLLLVDGDIEKLFDTPALEDALPYKRAYYFRQKVAFCVPRPALDKKRAPTDLFELNEKRLTTLLDLNSYCDAFPLILGDPQLFIELLHMIGSYVFRSFAKPTSIAPPNIFVDDSANEDAGLGLDGGNPMDKYSDYTAEEQAWGMLSACYDLLLKAIEHIDKLEKHVRKEFFPLRFIAQLVNLFKSPSFKERQVLKGVLHRLYYKLTQRRSAIRKEIANMFYEYIYETSNHYGVAELLEILGSIVNGFACPIKEEHITLLERALIPLHSTPAFISYHQQLAYCMIQYVSKDHSLFTPIVRGLLKYWPVGNSFKEVVFIVEFEELLEHCLAESDFDTIARRLARRLGMCMVSSQFQVSERAISCWNSASCVRIMNEYEKVAQGMFDVIKPYLRQAMTTHWNPIIQQKAHETYMVYYNMGYEQDESFWPVVNGGSADADDDSKSIAERSSMASLPAADELPMQTLSPLQAPLPSPLAAGIPALQLLPLQAVTMTLSDDDAIDVVMPGSPSNKMPPRLSADSMEGMETLADEDEDEDEAQDEMEMKHPVSTGSSTSSTEAAAAAAD
jgi:serine/threonine-protein phosphatase 2A regulatory subunit B'